MCQIFSNYFHNYHVAYVNDRQKIIYLLSAKVATRTFREIFDATQMTDTEPGIGGYTCYHHQGKFREHLRTIQSELPSYRVILIKRHPLTRYQSYFNQVFWETHEDLYHQAISTALGTNLLNQLLTLKQSQNYPEAFQLFTDHFPTYYDHFKDCDAHLFPQSRAYAGLIPITQIETIDITRLSTPQTIRLLQKTIDPELTAIPTHNMSRTNFQTPNSYLDILTTKHLNSLYQIYQEDFTDLNYSLPLHLLAS